MRMMKFTPKFSSSLAPSRLALALAGLILLPSMEAAAVDLTNGASATIVPGHPWVGQSFTLRNAASLTVRGAAVGTVNASNSTVALEGAAAGITIFNDSRGTIQNSTLQSLRTSANLGDTDFASRSRVAISNSHVEGGSNALQLSGDGRVRADNTSFSGNVTGAQLLAGNLELRNGSSVTGGTNGIVSRFNAGGQPAIGPGAGICLQMDRIFKA